MEVSEAAIITDADVTGLPIKDLLNLIPYLSAYMGHLDFRATQYYLRLTAEIYPEMTKQMEIACMDIIPEGGFPDEKS